MQHRHLNHENFTPTAIDDIIGHLKDWIELRRAAAGDRILLEKVQRIRRAHVADSYAQRYHLWMHYAAKHPA